MVSRGMIKLLHLLIVINISVVIEKIADPLSTNAKITRNVVNVNVIHGKVAKERRRTF